MYQKEVYAANKVGENDLVLHVNSGLCVHRYELLHKMSKIFLLALSLCNIFHHNASQLIKGRVSLIQEPLCSFIPQHSFNEDQTCPRVSGLTEYQR